MYFILIIIISGQKKLIMDGDPNKTLMASLVKFIQWFCTAHINFDKSIHFVGQIFLSVDTAEAFEYVVDERLCKTDKELNFISNSFDSLIKNTSNKDDKSKSIKPEVLERNRNDVFNLLNDNYNDEDSDQSMIQSYYEQSNRNNRDTEQKNKKQNDIDFFMNENQISPNETLHNGKFYFLSTLL